MSDLIERAQAEARAWHEDGAVEAAELLKELIARIRELEAEVESYRNLAGEQQTKWAIRCTTAEAERDAWRYRHRLIAEQRWDELAAKEATTIGRCAAILRAFPVQIYGPDSCKPATFDDAADAILALVKPALSSPLRCDQND